MDDNEQTLIRFLILLCNMIAFTVSAMYVDGLEAFRRKQDIADENHTWMPKYLLTVNDCAQKV